MPILLPFKWPDTPLYHGGVNIQWNGPTDHTPFRTCSYCGSAHPEDLYEGMTDRGFSLKGSDWKYGYPHKFYVTTPSGKHGKFYSCHIADILDDITRDVFCDELARKTGIQFYSDPVTKTLMYRAPYHGFQA